MTRYPPFNNAHSREGPRNASTRTPKLNPSFENTVDSKPAKKATKKETTADATNETSENRAAKGKEIPYKRMSHNWKPTKSYNHLGAAMFVNEKYKEERTEFYGEAKDGNYEKSEKEDGKVVTYAAGRGNTLVDMSKNDPKKVYPAIPRDVKEKREWKVSVSFNKDTYKLAEIQYNDPNLVLKGSAVEVAKGGKHFVAIN